MGIGQTVKKGFSIAGSSWDLIASLFVFGLAWNLINLALSTRIPEEGNPDPVTSALMIGAGIVFVFLTIFFQSGSLGYVRDRVKGAAVGMSTFFESGRRYYLSVLAVALVVTLIIGVFVILAAVSATLFAESAQVLSVILALAFAALGISFVILLFLAPYIIVADGVKAAAAMRQSMTVVKKNLGILLGLSLLLVLVGFGVGLLLGALFAALALVIQGMVSQVIFAVLSSAVNAYLGVVVTGSFMTMYLSLPKPSVASNN